jgi:hypothetical protein
LFVLSFERTKLLVLKQIYIYIYQNIFLNFYLKNYNIYLLKNMDNQTTDKKDKLINLDVNVLKKSTIKSETEDTEGNYNYNI